MASDGMLLNFEIGDVPFRVTPTVKGGHWKQRRGIQKRLRSSKDGLPMQRKKSTETDNTIDKEKQPAEPPQKKPRLDQPAEPATRQAKGTRPREVISSLFSFNPVAKSAVKDAEDQAVIDIAPSNAPLAEAAEGFQSLGLSQTLATHLSSKLNVKDPTAVQKEAIPRLLQDNADAFIRAQTGSGKTLAYLLPLVQKLMGLSEARTESTQVNRHSGLFAIILAPTRELAKQIYVVLDSLLRCAHWLVAGIVIGGEKKKSEKARLRKGLNILVATPGRLVDHLSHTDALDVSSVRWLILDEGDRLVELGFEQDIKAIVETLEKSLQPRKGADLALPPTRTTILCSATMKTNVQRLGEVSLKDAIYIQVDDRAAGNNGPISQGASAESTAFSAPAQLKQSYILVPAKQRLTTLFSLLTSTFARKGSVVKAIVFLSCADSVEYHFSVLARPQADGSRGSSPSPDSLHAVDDLKDTTIADAPTLASPSNPGLKLYKLHGSLTQSLRTSTLASFSRITDPAILICTDVASRGLDLPSIDLVIEYDPAFSAEDHLHRIGRTARAGRDGRATVFLMPGTEESYVRILEDSYTETPGAKVTRQDAEQVMKRGFSAVPSTVDGQNPQLSWEDAATEYQLDVERWVIANPKAHELARKAYISHVRAYATHIVPERHIFDIKDLHLGHLAKAFGLREPPANMGRSNVAKTKSSQGSRGRGNVQRPRSEKRAAADEMGKQVDQDEAAQKMRRAVRTHMNAASEFNIG